MPPVCIEMVPSPDSIEIPFDVMEINTRAAKFDPATREEGLLLDCPSCSCQCPQINQTSTLSSPTPPETSTATSTERNPPERDEQERISGGSDQGKNELDILRTLSTFELRKNHNL